MGPALLVLFCFFGLWTTGGWGTIAGSEGIDETVGARAAVEITGVENITEVTGLIVVRIEVEIVAGVKGRAR